ncbi:MAG: chromosomal replication initiator DnaA, partial [Pseudomonadota bacterium]
WAGWPRGRFALTGERRSGKTHLVHVWAEMTGARVMNARDLREADLTAQSPPALVIEDVDRISALPPDVVETVETTLFHLYNLRDDWGCPLLLTGVGAPSYWKIDLPDLGSRLSALTFTEISPPDDALLSSLLVKLFTDRQIRVDPKVVDYTVRRMERSFAAAENLVAKIDALSLEQKRGVTTALVRKSAGWTE